MRIRGSGVIDDVGDAARPRPASRYTVFTPYFRAWRDRRPARRARRPAQSRRCPRPLRRGDDFRRSTRSGSSRRSTDPSARRRGRRRERLDAVPALRRPRVRARTTTTSRRSHLRGCRPTCTSAASRRARSRSASPAAKGAADVPPPARAGATSTTSCSSLPAQRPIRVPGPLPGLACAGATRERRFEAWTEGRTGFPLVDAGMRQLRREGLMHNRAPARRRVVPDQGPRHRLALGRALVHAAADRRRRGEQQRQLAVDRLGRRRPAAGLPPHLQPRPPHGALRPGGRLRAPLRPRASHGPRRAPARAVEDAGRDPATRSAA